MRLITFSIADGERFGAHVGKHIIDLVTAHAEMNGDNQTAFPITTLEFLRRGAAAHAAVNQVLDYAQDADNFIRLQASNAVFDEAEITYLPPVTRPGKIICIGQNYRAHVTEMGHGKPPGFPLFFAKYANTLVGHKGEIVLPRVSHKVDYDAELVVVLGRTGKHIAKEVALDYVGGYMNFNDVSVRDYQRRTSQFLQGKTFDTTGPAGAALVTKDEIKDPHNLEVQLRLNDETMQHGTTADFIFDIPTIINYLSDIMTLEPGDMIATGTPSGVGFARDPQVFLKAGDTIEIQISGLGVLRNSVVEEKS